MYATITEIPKSSRCSFCGNGIHADHRMKRGMKYCTISCEDLAEEINQGDDYKNLERDEDYFN